MLLELAEAGERDSVMCSEAVDGRSMLGTVCPWNQLLQRANLGHLVVTLFVSETTFDVDVDVDVLESPEAFVAPMSMFFLRAFGSSGSL